MTQTSDSQYNYKDLPKIQVVLLLASILIVALCGIVYELIIGTVSSYLMGNSVYQFSLTIGFFMFAMGVGSYVSRFIHGNLVQAFIIVELVLSIVGGLCSITLFMVFPIAPWFFNFAMFGFIFVIGFLVGLEIPLLTRILSERSSTRESISDVLSLDYIGALIGSVAFPLLLLPSLGLITASFAIGLANAMVALLNVFWLREHLENAKRMLGYVALTLVALIGLTLAAGKITAFAQDHLYFDRIVYKKQTKYQSLVVTNTWQKNDVRLFIDGHLQFAQVDEYRYHEALVHPVMSWNSGEPESVLILGGGDGLAIREVLKYPGVKQIDLVDLDPDMTDLGTNYPPIIALNNNSMHSSKVKVINQDAFVFVNNIMDENASARESSLAEHKYDRIIIDFPDPHNEALSKLYSVEFYAMVASLMSEQGVLVTQASSPFFAPSSYWTVSRTLEDIFPEVVSYQTTIPSFGIWGFHIATRAQGTAMGTLPDSLRSVSAESFAAAKVFSKDLLPKGELPVNSLFDPKIYYLYARDLSGV